MRCSCHRNHTRRGSTSKLICKHSHMPADVRKRKEDLVGRGALLGEFDLDFAAKSIDIDAPR